MIRARDPSRLPDIRTLRRLTRSLAMLEAILFPEWEYRYHSFDAHWGPGELMASLRNGQGDHWFALFSAAGVVIIGLDHESPMYRPNDSWPGLFDGIPAKLAAAVVEPAFDARNATFCLWRLADARAWDAGRVELPAGDVDGSARLLSHLDGAPESFRAFAADHYAIDVKSDPIAAVYRHEPLTEELVGRLNPHVSLRDLGDDIAEIGYPDGDS